MDSFWLDLKYAVRTLAARPAFTLLAVMTLSIGIGVNAVAFNAFNSLFSKPFRFANSETLGWIIRGPVTGTQPLSLQDYRYLAEANRTFEGVIAEGRMPLSMRDGGRTQQVWALLVSGNYFSILQVKPELGRIFTDPDTRGSDIVAVVSHRFWFDTLSGGSIAGRTVTINGRAVSIIGVLPDEFQGPGGLYEPDIWIPVEHMQALNLPQDFQGTPRAWLGTAGRLRPNVTAAQAQADLDGLAVNFSFYRADAPERTKLTYVPVRDGNPQIRSLARMAYVGLAVVAVVLLIACFNMAGLLFARAVERQTEIGVRAAMGASRRRILRQLVTEGLVLAVLGGMASLVVTAWSADLLSTFSLPSPIPQRLHMSIDRRLIGFTLVMVIIAGVLPTIMPAFHATTADVLRSIRSQSGGGARPSHARNAFVVAQIAGSTLFLGAALLFVRSYWNSAAEDPGFDTEHTLIAELDPSTRNYDETRARLLLENLLVRVRALPGVSAAAVADRVPFYVGFAKTTDMVADASDCSSPQCRSAMVYAVGDGFFNALGIPLEEGREFSESDVRSGTGVIVSETMANRLWPNQRAVGRSIREGKEGRHLEVIGVARDVKHRMMNEEPGSYLYRPFRPSEFSARVTVVVRTAGSPLQLAGPVQDEIAALDTNLAAVAVKTMTKRMEMPLWPSRTAAGFSSICGILAVVLATLGLFGVTSYAIGQRTREFGIRAALGASPRSVMGLVIGEGLKLAAPGVLLGVLGAVGAGRLLSSMLFGVSASDPATLVLTAVIQVLIALAACAIPARRATRVDPIDALRTT
jgi:predicted permease